MYKYFLTAFALIFLSLGSPAYAGAGNHNGEIEPLEYSVSYLDSKGVTTVHESGIDFIPFDPEQKSTFSDEVLPEKYFGDYSLYFVEDTLGFEVMLSNTGKRTYNNLHVIATHELFNVDGEAGVPFEDGKFEWFVDHLGPGDTVVLSGSMFIPVGSPNGIDQTHIEILHGKGNGDLDDEPHNGRVIVDDPHAGLWCPVSPNTE